MGIKMRVLYIITDYVEHILMQFKIIKKIKIFFKAYYHN